MFLLSYLFCLHVCLCTTAMPGLINLKSELTVVYELPYGCWELSPGSVQKQMLLTAKSSL